MSESGQYRGTGRWPVLPARRHPGADAVEQPARHRSRRLPVAEQLRAVATSPGETALLAVVFAVLFYVAILGHELAHAWVARLCGFPVHSITLWALGGFTAYERRTPSPLREGIIAASGPVSSVLIGIACKWLADADAITDIRVATVLWALGVSNVFLGIFNALPGLPLDGGAVVKSVVWAVTRDEERGTIVAAWAGRVVAVLVFAALVWPDLSNGRAPDIASVVFGGMISAYLYSGASQSLRSAQVSRRVPGITARTLARRAVAVAADLPLAEALRQAGAASATGIVVVDAAGRPRRSPSATPWRPCRRTAGPGCRSARCPWRSTHERPAGGPRRDGPAPGDAGRPGRPLPRARHGGKPGRGAVHGRRRGRAQRLRASLT